MSSLHGLCLMPVYNHLQRSTETAVRCFLNETHPHKTLLIGDDRPYPSQFSQEDVQIPNVVLYQMATRAKNLAAKYSAMVDFADRVGIQYDFVAIHEDDDLIRQHRLATAADLIDQGAPWVYYHRAYASLGSGLMSCPSEGMFWSAIAISKKALRGIGGFGDCPKMGFDQLIIQRLLRYGEPAYMTPAPLIYRGDESDPYHTSALSTGFSDTGWWNRTQPQPKTGPLEPKLDKWAVESFREVAIHEAKGRP